MTVIWCSACLLVIPIVVALHQTDLHKKSSLGFTSARHRIVIWNTTAAKVWKSPILGIGADATATLTEVEAKQNLAETGNLPRDGQFEASAARHAHNVFLQVWYELGAVGALLFMAVGLAVLALIARVNATAQPALLAHFAAVVGLMSFSYSVWQLWFQGAIGLGIMAMTLAVIMIDRKAHPLNQA